MKQLVVYFFLSYLISWVIWLPLYGPKLGITNLPVLPFHHGLGGLGPMLGAFIATLIFEKQAGLRRLISQCFQVRPLVYLGIALAGPLLLALLVVVYESMATGNSNQLQNLFRFKEFPQFTLLQYFFYNLVFFGFGEETGWRGFALPRLQYRFNALTASLLLTIFWAAWHVPLFLYRPGYTYMDFGGIAGWVFSLLTGSVLLTWLYNSSKGSVLICVIFHATIDIAFTAKFTNPALVNYIGMLITLWGIATILIFKPKNLSRSGRIVFPAIKPETGGN